MSQCQNRNSVPWVCAVAMVVAAIVVGALGAMAIVGRLNDYGKEVRSLQAEVTSFRTDIANFENSEGNLEAQVSRRLWLIEDRQAKDGAALKRWEQWGADYEAWHRQTYGQ